MSPQEAYDLSLLHMTQYWVQAMKIRDDVQHVSAHAGEDRQYALDRAVSWMVAHINDEYDLSDDEDTQDELWSLVDAGLD